MHEHLMLTRRGVAPGSSSAAPAGLMALQRPAAGRHAVVFRRLGSTEPENSILRAAATAPSAPKVGARMPTTNRQIVMPAAAGIHMFEWFWAPAFAGATTEAGISTAAGARTVSRPKRPTRVDGHGAPAPAALTARPPSFLVRLHRRDRAPSLAVDHHGHHVAPHRRRPAQPVALARKLHILLGREAQLVPVPIGESHLDPDRPRPSPRASRVG